MSYNVSNMDWTTSNAPPPRRRQQQQQQQHDDHNNHSASSSVTRPTSPTTTTRHLPSYSHSYAHSHAHSAPLVHFPDDDRFWYEDARPILPKASFFMGDLRDGLPMLNMQAAFLISARDFTEKQVGVLFFVFGMSQFLCLAPAGYYLDYSRDKIRWVNFAGMACAALTVLTALTSAPNGENMGLMILYKVLQGSITSIFPTGFNGVTLGIVGSTGFTKQVSRNRVMTHVGTAFVVAMGSLIAYILYPNIGVLFIVSPLFCIFFVYYMRHIKPTHVNPEAASALIVESPTMTEYEEMDDDDGDVWGDTSDLSGDLSSKDSAQQPQENTQQQQQYVPPKIVGETNNNTNKEQQEEPIQGNNNDNALPAADKLARNETSVSAATPQSQQSGGGTSWSVPSLPSFNFGWGQRNDPPPCDDTATDLKSRRPQTPLSVLIDPTLLTFVAIVFSFHLSNSSVLPLVMQSLKVKDPQTSILLSGLCILIAQGPMAYFAKLCGDYSPQWGRKNITLVGLASLSVRCFLLTFLSWTKGHVQTLAGLYLMKTLILSTQFLDSVGAGIFGTMYILVTSDISGGTGRFSLLMGMTTSAMCLGGTVSGYIGQALAQDYGYPPAFFVLGLMSLVPFLLYAALMPETLPDYAKIQTPKRRNKKTRLEALLKKLNKHRKQFLSPTKEQPFRTTTAADDTFVSSTYYYQESSQQTSSTQQHAPGTAVMELV